MHLMPFRRGALSLQDQTRANPKLNTNTRSPSSPKYVKRSSTTAFNTPESSLGWTPTPHHQLFHPTDPQHWLCWSPEQTPWSARHLLTICPPAGQQLTGNPRWTVSFIPGKISRQNKAPYPPALKHHHSSFYILCHDEEKEILPSDHHHPHPSGCQMKIQAISTGEAQLIYLQIIELPYLAGMPWKYWKPMTSDFPKPHHLTSLSQAPRPVIQSGLEKQCRDAFVYHQELLPFYHIICGLLHIKRINSLVFPWQHVQENQHNHSSLNHSNGRKWQWHDR